MPGPLTEATQVFVFQSGSLFTFTPSSQVVLTDGYAAGWFSCPNREPGHKKNGDSRLIRADRTGNDRWWTYGPQIGRRWSARRCIVRVTELGMASPRGSCCFRPTLTGLALLCATAMAAADAPTPSRATSIRMGPGGTIIAVHLGSSAPTATAGAAPSYPFPRPRLTGFPPLVAVTTSDRRRSVFEDDPYSHDLQFSYVGSPLHAPANQNIVVGFLDSGAAVDLLAGSSRGILGVTGSRVTDNTMELGGVGGSFFAPVSQPIGVFLAGLGSIDEGGLLDLNDVVGHTNVSVVAADPIECGNGEVVTALIGMPFLTFFNSVIRVDTPRRATVNGVEYLGPDVQIQDVLDPIPEYPHAFAMEFGALLPALGAAFMQDLDDPLNVVPGSATSLSLIPGSFVTGGAFFVDVQVLQGEPGPLNPAQTLRMMVDTGAQSSIISGAAAANLNLPFEPDFEVEACGVGGLEVGVPGYYIDFVQVNAFNGPLRWSRAPFIMLDLPSPEGGTLDGILGMNFFWDRNVIFEPSLTLSSFFHVSNPIPVAFADSNVDFHVDAVDASFFLT